MRDRTLRLPRLGKLVVFRGKPEQLSTRTRLQLNARQFLEMSSFFPVVSGPPSPGTDRPLTVTDSPRHDALPNRISPNRRKVQPERALHARINLLWINLWRSQP